MAAIKQRILLILLFIGIIGFFIWQEKSSEPINTQVADQPEQVIAPKPTFTIKKIEVVEKSTYSVLMKDAGIDGQTAADIFESAKELYDLSKIRVGKTIDLKYDIATDALIGLIYKIDTEEEIIVEKTSDVWQATRQPIPYEVKIVTSEGSITSSMYQAALDAGIDERAIIDLADVFQWSVDFALDVRVGDTFKFIYEQRYLDGEYIMPAKILAGKYVNAGTPYYAFHFSESEENTGYFDQNGASVQKLFLKAPVSFRYISSGFTTGQRYVKAFNVSTGHRAIDYAAASGTPVRSVGDGTVTFAGWNGPYGNFITVRHNGTYSTNYAHLSKFAVKKGSKISQGQTIGYVGSTGFSTGPHLHYEMVKNGTKVNPLNEVLPPGAQIKEENKPAFFEQIKDLAKQLGLELTI
jgi:murein DD-endopeptidase MepM/ murein hydrolase activator NlpD